MGNRTTPLSSLPRDLLPSIISELSVDSALDLRTAVSPYPRYSAVSYECTQRLSVVSYIERSLGDAPDIMRSMSQNSVILSGPRSLEFFVPGSTSEQAWEFYVNDSESRASSFMYAMEKLGVAWKSPIDLLSSFLDGGTGDMCVSFASFAQMIDQNIWGMVKERAYKLERHDKQAPPVPRMIVVSQRMVVVTVLEPSNLFPTLACTVPGTFRGSEIQLKVTNRANALDMKFLYDFDSSCMQSFITAHTACHLYGKLASRGLTYHWNNEGTRSTMYGNVRVSDDQHSTFLRTFNNVEAPENVVKYHEYMSRTMVWYQTTNYVEQLGRPWKLMDNKQDDLEIWSNQEVASLHPILEAWK
jgi:hypothetical protein